LGALVAAYSLDMHWGFHLAPSPDLASSGTVRQFPDLASSNQELTGNTRLISISPEVLDGEASPGSIGLSRKGVREGVRVEGPGIREMRR